MIRLKKDLKTLSVKLARQKHLLRNITVQVEDPENKAKRYSLIMYVLIGIEGEKHLCF